MHARLVYLLCFAAGCNATGLGELTLPTCEDNGPCEAINLTLDPTSCRAYACDLQAGRCVETERDLDGDNATPIACGGSDCNDHDAMIGPGREELCGNVVDEDCSDGANDMDCDGRYSLRDGGDDCDDHNADIHPGAEEVCGNSVDEDCSGQANDLDCDGEDAEAIGGADCDDTLATRSPRATEVCNGLDDDCNDLLDGPDEDDDGDGHADRCAGALAADCDDDDPLTYVGAPELCDGIDNDCVIDGFLRLLGGTQAEEAEDLDGDGHSAIDAPCIEGEGAGFFPRDDCDDTRAEIHPGAFEICDGLDNDCDGIPDNRPGSTEPGSGCISLAVSAGNQHSCVLRQGGTVACWGENNDGQIGDRAAPVHSAIAVQSVSDVTDVAAGGAFSCALTSEGTVTCWGWEGVLGAFQDYDMIGDGALGQVPGVADATHLAAGFDHACAIVGDGQVWCWGGTRETTLDGVIMTSHASHLAVQVPDLTDAIALDAGRTVSCAVRATGQVVCWGRNSEGQLGNGDHGGVGRDTVQGIDNAVDVACGLEHACALADDGTVSCWGRNVRAQLGCPPADGCFDSYSSPLQVPGIEDAVEIDAGGGSHTCALLASGEVTCWGDGSNGAMGDGNTSTASGPVLVDGLGDATGLAVGRGHACVFENERLLCWGAGYYGKLGRGDETDAPRPVPVSALAGTVQVDGNHYGTCFRLPDLSVRCSGDDARGELGGVEDLWAHAVFGITDAVDMCVGSHHSCFVRSTGHVTCFGADNLGELGGSGEGGQVTGVTGAVQVVCGSDHSCALLSSGEIRCWGSHQSGQLGTMGTELEDCVGGIMCSREPLAVDSIDDAIALTASGFLTCALRANGVPACWGRNNSGEAGSHPFGTVRAPRDVVGLPEDDPTVQILTGAQVTCALARSGAVWCWGRPLAGSGSGVAQPRRVTGISEAVSMAMAQRTLCVLLETGQTQCLGQNDVGQAGTGTFDEQHEPWNVAGLFDVRYIGCGSGHCCATRTSGQTLCWGRGTSGQLANGQAANAPTPTPTVDLLLR